MVDAESVTCPICGKARGEIWIRRLVGLLLVGAMAVWVLHHLHESRLLH